MQINFKVDLDKIRQKQRAKARTGQSMQAVVNGALANQLPQVPAQNVQPAQTTNPNNWGKTNA